MLTESRLCDKIEKTGGRNMRKVLIVVDMQDDFVDGALGTKEAQAIVAPMAEKIKRFDGDVIATLDTHFENYMETSEGKRLPVPHCIKGTDGWQINKTVLEALREKGYETVEKRTFGSVDLPKLLKKRYGDETLSIELAGLCTDICVVSNALLLKAHFPETEIGVDASCCAGVTPQSHNAAIETMRMCQINMKE